MSRSGPGKSLSRTTGKRLYIPEYIQPLMPSEDKRSVIELGSSKVISLPKTWLDFYDVKGGNEVTILTNSIILVIPPDYPKDKLKKLKEKLKDVV